MAKRRAAPEPFGGTSVPVVGVGASAGGLEAFTDLLRHLPGDTGMAFVLIQHLDPKHESHLTELLSKASRMPVAEVKGDTGVQANHIYVIPPRRNLTISGGVLHTVTRPKNGPNMPIDSFLTALAEDSKSNAFGVILSGTASDGTLGLEAIRAAGGVTFAQEIRSAKFDGMPRSAIAARAVDFVLPPAGIAEQLTAIARNAATPTRIDRSSGTDSELNLIFRILRKVMGVDFTDYKQSTIKRRLTRRMGLRGFDTLQEYIQDLDQNREEVTALCNDLLIPVTAFFREPEVFQALKRKVLPTLVDNRKIDEPLRVWVPGCATGEEAYSVAMCCLEFLDETGLKVPLQVFASDLCDSSIEKARTGVYGDAALKCVSAKRLAGFFTRSEGGYQIAKRVRDVCVFARQNLAEDPPFSKLDLISCCNVLIYLKPSLQRRILSILHYALRPSGFLVLGRSEGTGALSDLFRRLDKNHNIYRVLPAAHTVAPELSDRCSREVRGDVREARRQSTIGPAVREQADRLLLAEYAPPGVIVDDDMKVLQVRGHTGPYLEISEGKPSQDLLRMVREGLLAALAKAIRTAKQRNAVAVGEGLRIESNGQVRRVKVNVIPFRGSSGRTERYFLVLFEDVDSEAPSQPSQREATGAKRKGAPRGTEQAARLRLQLAATKEYLQSIIESKEAALTELRSANEDAQAANEELETAQEELQSANEELNTLNDEMRVRNAELGEVNRDLSNLLESISIPLVMVGRDLRIRRFTKAIEPILNLLPGDAGRAITEVEPQIQIPDLRQLLVTAMKGREVKQGDVQDSKGCWFSFRILPSKGLDGAIDGAVVLFIDIDAARRGRDFAEAVTETMRQPLVVLNKGLRVVTANKAFYDTFAVAREDTEDRLIYDLGDGQWNIPRLRELLEDILATNSTFRDFEVEHDFEHIGRKVMVLNACKIFDPNAKAPTILLAIEDTTDRKRAEEALQTTNSELQHFAYALTHDVQEPLRMVVNFTQLLAQEHKGKLGHEADKYIAYSVEGALRIEALLKALLGYWEVTEQGQDSFSLVNCNTVLANALSNLQTAITESGAVVTSDPLPTIVAEQVMLVQLFQNLIANSIKFRREEPPTIHISAEKNQEGWLFCVQDNGIGIDAQGAGMVFGMFKRLHGKEIPGTGIGLALCKKVVERHGGRIWVESDVGRGSAFKFTICTQSCTTDAVRSGATQDCRR